MHGLASLIADAVVLANPDDTMHRGRLWRDVGGRTCPIGLEHRSQPVFEDIRTGETDIPVVRGSSSPRCSTGVNGKWP